MSRVAARYPAPAREGSAYYLMKPAERIHDSATTRGFMPSTLTSLFRAMSVSVVSLSARIACAGGRRFGRTRPRHAHLPAGPGPVHVGRPRCRDAPGTGGQWTPQPPGAGAACRGPALCAHRRAGADAHLYATRKRRRVRGAHPEPVWTGAHVGLAGSRPARADP